MDQHARDTLAELGLRLADALHELDARSSGNPERTHGLAATGGTHPGSGQRRRGPPARPARAKPRGGVTDALQRAL